MNRRRRERRKRMIIAYTARTCCVLVLVGMIFLMGCGCLYIHEHFFQDQKEDTKKEDKDNEKNNTGNDDAENSDNSEGQDNDSSVQTNGNDVTPFTYPDATGLYIVLDAGHGGGDGGTVNSDETVIEKDINLSVVLKMKSLLEECGAKVLLTRDEDKRVSLEDRSYISNQTNADLFVSIHCNSFDGDDSISGMECYYHQKSEVSKGYAESLIQTVESIGNINTRYAMDANYQVLRDSSIPAILVEMGYLSNMDDCQNLTSAEYQDTIAQSLVEAIVKLLKAETAA